MDCLSKEKVAQRVTPGRIRWFQKEVLRVNGPQPLAMVRKRRVDGPTLAPVLLVHGFGQNRNAWHLPERSFVNHLAEQGFDVFNLDLRGHGRSAELGAQRSSSVDDYIRGDLPEVITQVLERSGFARTLVMGHSLGGLCVAAAGALDPERVAAVVTLGSPHALGRGHAVLGRLLRMLQGTVGRTGLMRNSQVRLPVDLIGKLVHASRFAWDSALAPIPVRAWKPGSFSESELKSYIERSFDGASLGSLSDLMELASSGDLRSRMDGKSYTQLIEQSELPLLTVAGASDLLVNRRAARPLFERSVSLDKRYLEVDAGHGDLLVGKQAPSLVWPVVASWLLERASLVEARRSSRRPALHLVRNAG